MKFARCAYISSVWMHCSPSSQTNRLFLSFPFFLSSLKTGNAGPSGFQLKCAFTLWYPWHSLFYCLEKSSWWQWSLNEANNGPLLSPQSLACLKIDSLVDWGQAGNRENWEKWKGKLKKRGCYKRLPQIQKILDIIQDQAANMVLAGCSTFWYKLLLVQKYIKLFSFIIFTNQIVFKALYAIFMLSVTLQLLFVS